ncbi:hypothetical protein [Actinotalea ferrariae]|uniref:hypothetical protein n=1 Tax=Actinotalea ferrariae TaxID=1386098 RepID=UPI001C8CA9E2|nr:hypothetical protein [Actinotalea ferrariae]
MGTASRRLGTSLLVLVALVTSGGCTAGASGADLPPAITCTTHVRLEAGSAGGEESTTLTVDRVDGGAAAPEELTVAPFRLAVSYIGEAPEGRTVTVVVSDADGVIVRDLYQLADGDALRTQFAGGHGFTGLSYVYSGSAELQLWCAADA